VFEAADEVDPIAFG